jgi:ribonuclease HI
MKGVVQGSIAAEMLALCNATFIALKTGLVEAGDHILLQTDCVAAITAFEGQRNIKNPDERKAHGYLWRLKKAEGINISFRHVKGHTNNREARFVTNNLCDQRAKTGMREARATLKG